MKLSSHQNGNSPVCILWTPSKLEGQKNKKWGKCVTWRIKVVLVLLIWILSCAVGIQSAKISFNIILLILAVRIIAIFLLIDLFIFSSWWWMFDRYISIIDRKMSNTNECLINRFTSIVWKNSIVRQISIIKIVMVAPQRACRPLRDDVIE